MSLHSEASTEFQRLLEIMATLRSPDGCPWDREQTIDTLKKYVLEETYEVLEAIDRHDHDALREELGDFVLEAVFLAQLEFEAGHFSMVDALKGVCDKLIRRHPHIFARASDEDALHTAAQVRARWDEIKAAERAGQTKETTLLGDIPSVLPALLRAYQVGMRAASVGFDWTRAADVVGKIREEIDEIEEVVESSGHSDAERPARVEEEIGDLFFAMANLSRKLGVEPETALRKANEKFMRRFAAMETRISETGREMRDMSLEELEAEWQRTKVGLKN